MAIRLWKCDDCGHRMRVSGARCNRCHLPKRIYQRTIFWWPLPIIACAALFMTLTP